MRTYSRADWDAAQAAWADFSDEWEPFRKLAMDGGILFPPAGTKWDDWEDDSPSQRAMLIRAIRETPQLLGRSIPGCRSWSDVIGRLTGERDDMRRRIAPEPDLESRGKRVPEILATIIATAQSHRLAQLEAIAEAAREVVRLGNQQGMDDDEWGEALLSLEGLLLAIGDES